MESSAPEVGGGRCKHLRSQQALPFKGHKSEIQISPYFLDILSNPAVSSADKIWLQFELAKTLLHELAHAALNAARHKGSQHHYFFPGCSVSEDGFQLEARLFGGKTDLKRCNFSAALRKGAVSREGSEPLIEAYLTPWPSFEAVEEYRMRGSPMGTRGDVPKHSHGQKLRFDLICMLFTPGAWEEDVRRYGSLQLLLESRLVERRRYIVLSGHRVAY